MQPAPSYDPQEVQRIGDILLARYGTPLDAQREISKRTVASEIHGTLTHQAQRRLVNEIWTYLEEQVVTSSAASSGYILGEIWTHLEEQGAMVPTSSAASSGSILGAGHPPSMPVAGAPLSWEGEDCQRIANAALAHYKRVSEAEKWMSYGFLCTSMGWNSSKNFQKKNRPALERLWEDVMVVVRSNLLPRQRKHEVVQQLLTADVAPDFDPAQHTEPTMTTDDCVNELFGLLENYTAVGQMLQLEDDLRVQCPDDYYNQQGFIKGAEKRKLVIAIKTLGYGYLVRIRLFDDGEGDLMYHGAPLKAIFSILRNRKLLPSRPGDTCAPDLLKTYGAVPPLCWLSMFYPCAGSYPQSLTVGGYSTGQRLGIDSPPLRAILHFRTDPECELASKKDTNTKTGYVNEQHAFAPSGVLSLVAIDLIATYFLYVAPDPSLVFVGVKLADYVNYDHLCEWLSEWTGLNIDGFPEWGFGRYWDPRDLRQCSVDELGRLLALVELRRRMDSERRALETFIQDYSQEEQMSEELLHRRLLNLPESMQAIVLDTSSPGGVVNAMEALEMASAIDEASAMGSARDEAEASAIRRGFSSGKRRRTFLGYHALKGYNQRLRQALRLRHECRLYLGGEEPDPTVPHPPPSSSSAGGMLCSH